MKYNLPRQCAARCRSQRPRATLSGAAYSLVAMPKGSFHARAWNALLRHGSPRNQRIDYEGTKRPEKAHFLSEDLMDLKRTEFSLVVSDFRFYFSKRPAVD